MHATARTLTVLVLSALVWCPPAGAEAGKSITIWWAQWDPAVGLQKLGDEFAAETGIAVSVHQIPWASYQDQVFLNFGNRQTDFDIVVGDSQWIGRGATRGLYLELTDWLPQHVDIEAIHPLARRFLMEYPPGSGKYFAAPCETDALGFVYRRDWFEDPAEQAAFAAKYGRPLQPPDTWQEFGEVAGFFHRPGEKRYGCALLTGRGYDSLVMGFQPFLGAWGGSWGNRETFEVAGHVNSPEAAAGLRYFIELLQFAPPGGVSADYMQVLDAFMNGSTADGPRLLPVLPGDRRSHGGQGRVLPGAPQRRPPRHQPRGPGVQHLDQGCRGTAGARKEVHRLVSRAPRCRNGGSPTRAASPPTQSCSPARSSPGPIRSTPCSRSPSTT